MAKKSTRKTATKTATRKTAAKAAPPAKPTYETIYAARQAANAAADTVHLRQRNLVRAQATWGDLDERQRLIDAATAALDQAIADHSAAMTRFQQLRKEAS